MGGGAVGGDLGTGGRKHQQYQGDRKMKVIRLSELISVLKLPPNAEACPMENMSAFCVETEDRTLVFAALKDDCMDWVEKLCRSSFQRGGIGGSSTCQPHMEENQIYASADEVSDFWVVAQRTEAAARCELQGPHWLQVGQESLVLREAQTKSRVEEWPYELLRRYGNDKLTFSIEAGRRCASGPGTFIFETEQAEKIFSLIQKSIKQKKFLNQNQMSERAASPNTRSCSPLPKTPEVTSVSAVLENKLRLDEEKTVSHQIQKDTSGRSPNAAVKPPPITLQPLPDVPTTHSIPRSTGHPISQSQASYADPNEFILSMLQPTTTGVYVDPAVVLPLKPPGTEFVVTPPQPSPSHNPHSSSKMDNPEPIYSEVFDKVIPVVNEQHVHLNPTKEKCFKDEEYIYTEPISETEAALHKTEEKPDPFAYLYAQVCKTKPSPTAMTPDVNPSSPSAPSFLKPSTVDTDQTLSDVIYENLGII